MKKILVTGANSYIGQSFEKYMSKWPEEYQVETIDMIDGTWRSKDFSAYDVVYHVAGIAHRKETSENAGLYYEVNRDLSVEVAQKAKREGVDQFIFLSTMSVYGKNVGVITKETQPLPVTHYGKSKLEAEKCIETLRDDRFLLAILRPPMVYGKNCKGNFQSIIKLVQKLPIFPKVKNQRSMIYIDHLSLFVKMCIDKKVDGLYFPQNREYIQTTDIANIVASSINKRIYFSRLLGLAVKICMPFLTIAQKGFGTLVYHDTEDFDYEYCIRDNSESISESVCIDGGTSVWMN